MSLHVERTGSGPDLALLHGWAMHGGIWDDVRARLAQAFTLHVVDLPGHGHSRDVALVSLAAMAQEVRAALPDACAVCGWSMGGLVAMRMALDFPGVVRTAILVASTPCLVRRADWEHAMERAVLASFAQRLATDYEKTLMNFLTLQVLGDPHAKAVLQALRSGLLARGAPSADALQTGLAILDASDLRSEVPAIRARTLVIDGDRDTLAPASAGAWLAAHIPGARHLPFAHCGHAPFLSYPERFASEVESFMASP